MGKADRGVVLNSSNCFQWIYTRISQYLKIKPLESIYISYRSQLQHALQETEKPLKVLKRTKINIKTSCNTDRYIFWHYRWTLSVCTAERGGRASTEWGRCKKSSIEIFLNKRWKKNNNKNHSLLCCFSVSIPCNGVLGFCHADNKLQCGICT